MSRPRRAAAARASSAWKTTSSASPTSPRPSQQPPSLISPSPPSPTRKLRRASHRTAKRAPRSLARRRADFERIASHHLAALRNTSPPASSNQRSTLLSSFATGEDSELANVDLQLNADFVHAIRDNEEDYFANLCALLARIRRIANLTESEAEDTDTPPKPSSPSPSSDSQDQDFHGLTEALCAERFLSHDAPRIRLLVACTLAELLRICAPDPPVSPSKLRDICSLFVEQLAVIVSPNDPMENDRFSLLEQLATTKTFVLFADEEDVVCDLFACFYACSSAHQTAKVREYFADVLFSLIDEMEQVSNDVLDALLAPLVQTSNYSKPAVRLAQAVVAMAANKIQVPLCSMLNASIRQLRQSKSALTPEKHRGGRRKTPTKKLGSRPREEDAEGVSAHHDHIDDIVIAINRLAPDILIYVIPSLHDRIRSQDEHVRLANVHMLARLFTSDHDMSESYPTLFAEFLSRNKDVCPAVRAEVCAVLPKLMVTHRKHRDTVDSILQERCLDREESVRLVVIKSISEAVEVASGELLQILATRLRDRKAPLRHETLRQLVQMYTATSTTSTKGLPVDEDARTSPGSPDSENFKGSDPADSLSGEIGTRLVREDGDMEDLRAHKLGWLPDKLVQAHVALRGAGDVATAFEIEQVIFERIPGTKSDSVDALRSRLRRFAVFLGGLRDGEFLHVINLAQERKRARDALLELVDYRLRLRKTPPVPTPNTEQSEEPAPIKTFSKRNRSTNPLANTSEPPLASSEMRKLARDLSRFVRVKAKSDDELQRLCVAVATAVDLRVFEKLKVAIDENASQTDRLAACQDVVSRFGSKSPAGLFVSDELLPKCLPGVFSSLPFKTMCQLAREEAENPRNLAIPADSDAAQGSGDDCPLALCGLLRYLDIVRGYFPSLLGHCIDAVQSLVLTKVRENDSSSDVIAMGLKLVSNLPAEAAMGEGVRDIGKVFESIMFADKSINIEQSSHLAKWATRALIRLQADETAMTKPLSAVVKELALRLDAFAGDVESILAPMICLSQIAKHASTIFKPTALECFDFARALLCGSLNGKISAFTQDNGEGSSRSTEHRSRKLSRRSSLPSVMGDDAYVLPDQITHSRAHCMAELVHRSVKLLVYALSAVDSNFEEADSVFAILLKVIVEKRGDVFGLLPNESSESENETDSDELTAKIVVCAMSRLSAGRGMLYLARHPQFFRRISPPLFVSTVLLAQDSRPDVRIHFAKIVSNQILKKGLPFRWVVALPLMAVDPERQNGVKVKNMMTSLFRHRRRIYEKARLEGRSSSIQLLPESVLPEMIWTLASLPDVEIDRAGDFAESQQCLELLLDRLLESNDYASVLNEYIECMSIAQDATEPEDEGPGEKTERIGELGRIAGLLLKKKQAGKTWNLAEHPGQISLPKDMFRVINRKAETSGVAPPSLVEVAKMYDDDKIRVSSRKAKPSNLVARIKAVEATKSAASGSIGGRSAQRPRAKDSEMNVEEREELKSEESPADTLEPLGDIEHDPEPIEAKMGDALNERSSGQTPQEPDIGKKRRSQELDSPVSTPNVEPPKHHGRKKRRSDSGEAELGSGEPTKKLSRGKKRRSQEVGEDVLKSGGIPPSRGGGKKKRRSAGLVESPDVPLIPSPPMENSDMPSSQGGAGDVEKASSEEPSVLGNGRDRRKAEKHSGKVTEEILHSEDLFANATEEAEDTKENDAGNSQPEEGQSRRTLARGKQIRKEVQAAEKPRAKVRRSKKIMQADIEESKNPVVRRSRRHRKQI